MAYKVVVLPYKTSQKKIICDLLHAIFDSNKRGSGFGLILLCSNDKEIGGGCLYVVCRDFP